MSDFIIPVRASFLGIRLPRLRPAALRRLREACLRSLPGSRTSDWTEFYTRGVIDDQPCAFIRRRVRDRGTFYLRCDKRPECEIVGLVERSLRDICLNPGIPGAVRGLTSHYEIPILGVLWTTHADVWFNSCSHDDRLILVAVTLTAH